VPTHPDLQQELQAAIRLAREAARLILEVYRGPFEVVQKPGGGGPVTLADERANALIVRGLGQAFPHDGVVAEESEQNSDAVRHRRCWFVDPVDGTAEFVERNGMFAVHIGLAIEGRAALGVVYAPASDRLYAGIVGQGGFLEVGAQRRPLGVERPAQRTSQWRLVVSRSHKSKRTDQIRQALGIHDVQEVGSVGLKCGKVAEGAADLYLHPSSRSYRWDCCAPEAVLVAAGGTLTDLGGVPYRYDGAEVRNVRGMIGCASEALPQVLPIAQRVAREAGLL
jgi:3'(2'), 5'-bisphosphate nucleotidase